MPLVITKNARPRKSTTKILLVEPKFPLPSKSKNHKNFLPIGLLKLGAWFEDKQIEVELVRGNLLEAELSFTPDEVWITSLFTYWSKNVIDSSLHYKEYSNSPRIVVGGIYASLMPEHCQKETKAHSISVGVHSTAEKYYPAYHLLESLNGELDFQIVHASRGCIHKCKFCGVHVIEPNGLKPESHILPLIAKPKNGGKKICNTSIESDDEYEIGKRNLVFYDNNFLANEDIENILKELAYLKKKRSIGWCESQSGFDGRVLEKNPSLAKLLKTAGFRYPRIAWDWDLNQGPSIKRQIDILLDAGYKEKDISVFMIYNWGIPFEKVEEKRVKCFEWGVQIADCRYRPLDAIEDNYKSHVKTQSDGYHIHTNKNWTDQLVRQFRRNIRRQNICIRHGFPLYSSAFERKKATKEEILMIKQADTIEDKKMILRSLDYDCWDPRELTHVSISSPQKILATQQTTVLDHS